MQILYASSLSRKPRCPTRSAKRGAAAACRVSIFTTVSTLVLPDDWEMSPVGIDHDPLVFFHRATHLTFEMEKTVFFCVMWNTT